jgi:pullulanase
MTLWDKIGMTLPGDDALQRRALKLAGAAVLLSQGVPVLEGGAELGRTKGGSRNSYDGGDLANHFDWRRGLAFADVSDYYRGLIAIRRAHPAFRCATAADVRRTLAFLDTPLPPGTVAFTLAGRPTGDPWRRTLVILHGATAAATMTLPPGRWHLAVSGVRAVPTGDLWPAASLPLAPLSAYVLYEE